MMVTWAFNDLNPKENSADQVYLNIIAVLTVSQIGRGGASPTPSHEFFFETPIKTDVPLIWKTTPPPLKREAPFHEMIPRKKF